MINQPTAKARFSGCAFQSTRIVLALLTILLFQACGKQDIVSYSKVISSSPSNGQFNVDPEATISISFDSPIDTAAIVRSFEMISTEGLVQGNFNFKDSGFQFEPDIDLSTNTQYTVRLKKTTTDKTGR